jgi:signal transduction histidine kinase
MPIPDDTRAMSALYRLSSLATRAPDAHSALQGVMTQLLEVFGADAGAIALLNPISERLEFEVEVGLPQEGEPLDLKLGHGITGWCVLTAKPLLVPDVARESRYIAVRPTARCEMAVPMRDGDRVIGVIDLESDQVNDFGRDDLALLERLAEETTQLVLHLWRTRHLGAKSRQLETLLTTGQTLVAKLETQELFATLAREARRMMEARLCVMYLHDPAHRTVRCAAFAPADAATRSVQAGELPVNLSLAGAAFRTQHQVEFTNLQSPAYHGLADLPADRTIQSALFTPLRHEGEVFGALGIFLDRPHRFDDDEKRACATLANLGAVALQNARLYARVFESEQLLRKNEQLTTLGLLAAEIAHEIRNPLTVIKLLHGGLNLEFPADDPRRTDLRVINEKLDQLEGIVLRVLNVAKAPGALHSRWALTDIVADTLVLVRPKLAQSKVQLQYEPPAKPLVVDGNKGQLQQVLLNLIFNSLEAMPQGGALSLVFGEEMRGAASFATIDVADTGTGIPAELASQVFASFLSGRSGGTGLGLAIARRIVESHHGELKLLATGPAGTTMRIALPLAKG